MTIKNRRDCWRCAWKPLLTSACRSACSVGWYRTRGLAIALPVRGIVCSLAGDEFKSRDVVVNSVVLTLGSWLIFVVGLKLVIPLWPGFAGG